ncbi:MAG: tRNA pseudouridine(38-40) synthase TruA [Lachnospiraceae bacterium]|nr:tRNA pseudouridine(38-40) synthase TruA [Lachnospiraceae bacterium]
MKNYKLEIMYDGSRYYGWERQPGKETIQGKLEQVLSRMTGEASEVIGAGRTDAGVHARKMTANAHLATDLTEEEIRTYMNHYLPDDICVTDVKTASDRFHARYKATGKLYTYTCYVGEQKPVFRRKFVTVLPEVPDLEKMQEAAKVLTGTHDFKAFSTNPKMKKSTVRTVDKIDIVRKKDCIYLNFHGDGFLQNMVRILTGTLLEAGYGRMSPEDIRKALSSGDRADAGPTMPPQGLCLMEVDYD